MKKVFPIIATILIVFIGLYTMQRQTKNSPVKTTEAIDIVQTATPAPYGPLSKEKLWYLIQEWRKSDDCKPGGCEPYYEDSRLCVVAEDRVDDPEDNHDGFYEKVKSDYYGFGVGITLSENKTGGYSEEDMLKKWLNSPSHAAALREDYKYSCVAVDGTDPNSYYAIQIFSNL